MVDHVIVSVRTVVEAIQASGKPTVGICEADIFTYTKRNYNSAGTNEEPSIEDQTKKSIELGLELGIIEKQKDLYRLPAKSDPPTPKSSKSNSDKKSNPEIETLFKRDDTTSSSRKREHSTSSSETKDTHHADKESAGKPVKRKRELSRSSTRTTEPRHADEDDARKRQREHSKSPNRPAKKKTPARSCASDTSVRSTPRGRDRRDAYRSGSVGSNVSHASYQEEHEEMDEDDGSVYYSRFLTSRNSSRCSDTTYIPEYDEDESNEEDGNEEEYNIYDEPCNCSECVESARKSALYNRSFYKSDEYRSLVEYVVVTDEDLESESLRNKERWERWERRKAEREAMTQSRDRGENKAETKSRGSTSSSSSEYEQSVYSEEYDDDDNNVDDDVTQEGNAATSTDNNVSQYEIGVAGGGDAKNVGAEDEPIDEEDGIERLPKNVDVCQECCYLNKRGENDTLKKDP